MVAPQIYHFELDDVHGCVWIVYQHDRFRVNCSDLSIMNFWARYWYLREFPFANEKERALFRINCSMFLDANKDTIAELARYVAQQKITHLLDLEREIQKELAFLKKQAIGGETIRQKTVYLEKV
jgi:sarcosine oxidase delta subunit